ncbi:pilus assembly protein CpaF [Mobilisporobacter senegalensis]|uniref:Pilus assembly protein CpaF n=1 Tax=Mobilisporobacter senegalensis TaxID=1329262 RepID=A0A3N1XZR8_9FIRM|nr:ATPase, T2SS/T4P/T4SS family [Mobilisporobacter senegalensis]ROR31741.1 pilus assembly protein CpaF [Mobilisporobacter senegalensis]
MNNTNLIIISIIALFFICAALYFYAKGKKQVVIEDEYTTFDEILNAIKNHIVDLLKEDYEDVNSDEEYKKYKMQKAKFNEALKNSTYGIDSAKIMVKDIIRGFLIDNVPLERVEQIIGIDNDSEPSSNVMFEIIMYRYKKIYGRDALTKWITKNSFHLQRKAVGICKKGDPAFYITKENEEQSYFDEKIILSDDEKFDILTILLYQQFKGFGIADTILEMNINGVNIGCSGSVMEAVSNNTVDKNGAISEATNALWLYFGGNYIHLQFLDFGSEDEIRRIIQLLIRYNSPGPLTVKRGYIVNTMHDKSRILAIRPPAGEYWATFIRKFTLDNVTPESLINKKGVFNGKVCIKLIEFLMRGLVTTAVTGRQGSGKTTLMKAIIAYFDTRYNIGVLEMAPEMYLRELYPDRNIFSVQETDTVSAEDLQDALKKADRAITIIGEVATDPVAARMIQLGMTGSLCTVFSHHANQAKDLVLTLRNSLVNAGGFDNMTTAERQVTDVVKMNIHLDFTADGKRYIKRITEIIQLEEGIPYPEFDPNKKEESIALIQKEYYVRQTDRLSFTTRDILTYDTETDTYMPGECMSDAMIEKISSTLGREERKEFKKFINYYWKGIREHGYLGVDITDDIITKEEEKKVHRNSDEEDFKQAVKFLSGNDTIGEQFGFGKFYDEPEPEV